jgi:hypothetical protein
MAGPTPGSRLDAVFAGHRFVAGFFGLLLLFAPEEVPPLCCWFLVD